VLAARPATKEKTTSHVAPPRRVTHLPTTSMPRLTTPIKGTKATFAAAAKLAKPKPRAAKASGITAPKPVNTVTDLRRPAGVPMRPPKRAHAMKYVVGNLPQNVAPARLLGEFPTALTAEASYDVATSKRTTLVLTFPPGQPPASRTSRALGCVLQPVVTPPIGGTATRLVLWYRKDGAVKQREFERARTADGFVIPTVGGGRGGGGPASDSEMHP